MDDPYITIGLTRITLDGLPEAILSLVGKSDHRWTDKGLEAAARALREGRDGMKEGQKHAKFSRPYSSWVWLANVCYAAKQFTASTLITTKIQHVLAGVEED